MLTPNSGLGAVTPSPSIINQMGDKINMKKIRELVLNTMMLLVITVWLMFCYKIGYGG